MNNATDSIYDFDELKMYFGEDYWVTDKIKITQPTIGDILEFGDNDFYSIVSTICSNPTSFRLSLWKEGIDWNKVSDFELFCRIIRNFTPKDTHLLFGDLNFSWFRLLHDDNKDCDELVYIPFDENSNPILTDYEDLIIIDELVYMKMIKYLRKMFDINPKVEHAKNKATKEAMIWEDEENLKIQQRNKKDDDVKKSVFLPLISSMVNHPGFKYKTNELKEIGIVQFMDSVKRLQTYENTTALLKGLYSGFVDGSQIKNKDINWMKDLSE